jgi:hypothetical protein
VIMYGRFWVITEALGAVIYIIALRRVQEHRKSRHPLLP